MELRDRWNHLLPDAKPLGEDLLGRYSEPHRAYHNRRHLTEVLDAVDELAGEAEDPDTVRLAAWFHDAIYDPQARSGENEEASAQLAEAELAAYGLDAARVAEIGRLVRLTADHRSDAGDTNGAVLCDADLRILAADRERYDEYAAGIRREYAHVPDRDFARGRSAILKRLGTGRIFHTPQGYDAWERPARENLDRELAELRPGTLRPSAGLVPLVYFAAALGLVVAASILLGRGLAAAPTWPAAPGTAREVGWWVPVAGLGAAGLVLATWLKRAGPRWMLALCAPLAVVGAIGVIICRVRWPDPPPGVAISERWPYLLLASIAALTGGLLLALGCRLRTTASYSAPPRRVLGAALVGVVGVLVGWVALAAGVPFVQARLEAANTHSEVATAPPSAPGAVRMDGELAWTAAQTGAGMSAGTAGGLTQLRPDGVLTVDAGTGQTRWSYRRSDVIAADGLIVSADGGTVAVHLPAAAPRTSDVSLPTYAVLDAVSGTVLAELHVDGTALAVDRDVLVVADGNDVLGYPLGSEDRWRVRSECPVTRARIVAGTAVVIGSCGPNHSDTIQGLSTTDGTVLWSAGLGQYQESADQPAAAGYRVGPLAALPDSHQVAGLGWSPSAGGTAYQWVLDAGDGTVEWSAPLPGSLRPGFGQSGCDPGLMATPASLVVVACRTATAGASQVYDVAAVNPADGTPQWHHLLDVTPAQQDASYPSRGFALMTDGRVVTMRPVAGRCAAVTVGTVGVVEHPLVSGDVPVPPVTCTRPQATVATGRPILSDGTHHLALR